MTTESIFYTFASQISIQMNHRITTSIFLSLALLSVTAASAQTYSGERKYDGIHKNEVSGYLMGGYNVVTDAFFGEAGTYTRHLTERWSLSGGEQVQFLKQLYSADVCGTYRIPIRKTNLYVDGRFVYNRYQRWRVNEILCNLSFLLETSYFDLRLGESYVRYHMNDVREKYGFFTDAGYTEPLVMTFGVGVNIRPRSNPWNIGIFLRNYDHFYYENWNINWGIRFHASLTPEMKLFGEFNVRPAGNMSQVATRHETSLKLGLRHVW